MNITSSHLDALCVSTPLSRILSEWRPANFGKYSRDMGFAVVLSLFAAAIVYADEIPQSWVPEVIALPDDAELTEDRSVGSSIRMFSISTETDVEVLLGDWSAALKDDGYSIRPQHAELNKTTVEFSGHDILNAKIATEAASIGDRVVIAFDVTLR